MKYFVVLTIQIGENQKHGYHAIEANSKKEAGTQALINECHSTPDFDEFPEKDACWDLGEMIYTVYSVEPLSDQNAKVLEDLKITYLYHD